MKPAGQDIAWSGGPSQSCDVLSCGSVVKGVRTNYLMNINFERELVFN